MAKLFEKFAKFVKSEFGYTIKKSNKKSSFKELFGFDAKDIEPPRTPKERGADNSKTTCLNCKHLMFSDMYGECNKQLRIVNPSDTCEFAEPKERGGEE